MKNEEHLRTSIRLRIDKGLVLLRYGGVPSVACTLLDLSEGGCRCIAPLHSLDEQTAEAWSKILGPSRPLHVEISSPPYLEHLPLDVEIRTLVPGSDGSLELGLRFHNLDANQRLLLDQAILAVATDKVRGAFSPQQAGEAAQYLVGGISMPAAGSRPAAASTAPIQPPPSPAPPSRSAARPAGSSRPAPLPPHSAAPLEAPDSLQAEPEADAQAARSPSAEEQASEPPVEEASAPAHAHAHAHAHAPASRAFPALKAGAASETRDPFRGRRVGEVLIRMSKLTEDQVQDAVQKAKVAGERLGRYLLREGLVSPVELCRALALQSGLPMTDLVELEIPEPLGALFPHGLMARYEFVPFDESAKMLCVAAASPLPSAALTELERLSGKKIEVFLAQEDLVLLQVDKWQPKEKRQERKHARYEAALPVSFQYCNRLGRLADEAVHEGRTLDISEGGFLIEGPSSTAGGPEALLRRGLCMRITLVLASLEVKGLCSLRFIKAQEKPVHPGRPWTFGLQVLEMSSEDRRKLKEMCIQVRMGQAQGRQTPKPFPFSNA